MDKNILSTSSSISLATIKMVPVNFVTYKIFLLEIRSLFLLLCNFYKLNGKNHKFFGTFQILESLNFQSHREPEGLVPAFVSVIVRFSVHRNSDKCTLILTEGDSAKTLAVAGVAGLHKGRDIFGVFPLRGKLLNVRDVHSRMVSFTSLCHVSHNSRNMFGR